MEPHQCHFHLSYCCSMKRGGGGLLPVKEVDEAVDHPRPKQKSNWNSRSLASAFAVVASAAVAADDDDTFPQEVFQAVEP
jgi:hypothetical protein